VIVLAERRTCGTFAALSLVLGRIRPFFSRTAPGAPALFDGMRVEAYVARNKLGGSGQAATWHALVDLTSPASTSPASTSPAPRSFAMPIGASASAQATRIVEPAAAAESYRDRPRAQSIRRPHRGGAYEYAR
jgi:hypothetical protein